jgi:CMP-N,N'-diacetyllegionaminic acid synthase
MMKVLAIVPARGGSKGLPSKNIRMIAGKPLLAYTIQCARRSRSIDRLVVSTDAEAIANIAREAGAEVIMRPAAFATDEAPTELALLHALDTLKAVDGYEPDAVMTLEPTSPLRSPELIDRCVDAMCRHDADSILTVTETRECFGTIVDGRFEYLIKNQARRRQERAPLYRESSTVYLTRVQTLRTRRSVLGERLYPVIVDPAEAIDINSPLDLAVAEAVLRWKRNEGGSGE